MLQSIQIIATNIHILTVLVLWLCVMLLIRMDEGSGVHVGKHTGIVLAKPVETAGLVGDSGTARQCSLESFYVKFTIRMEALREILP